MRIRKKKRKFKKWKKSRVPAQCNISSTGYCVYSAISCKSKTAVRRQRKEQSQRQKPLIKGLINSAAQDVSPHIIIIIYSQASDGVDYGRYVIIAGNGHRMCFYLLRIPLRREIRLGGNLLPQNIFRVSIATVCYSIASEYSTRCH